MKPNFKAVLAQGAVALAVAAAGLAGSGAAFAATPTAAGTPITNKATLTYSVGAVSQTPIVSSPDGSKPAGQDTTFLVDNKISHTVVAGNTSSAITAAPGQTAVLMSFTVSNTGNAQQDYILTFTNLATNTTLYSAANLVTDSFDPTLTGCKTTVNGTQQSYISKLDAGSTATVVLSCDMPATLADNAAAVISLTATAATSGTGLTNAPLPPTAVVATPAGTVDDATKVDIVFADAAGTDDAARDGQASDRSAYKIVSSALTVSKAVTTLCDGFNGATNPKAIPDAFVQYTVTIANTGSASAKLAAISDALDSHVTFDADFITGANPATNCAAGVVPKSGTAGQGFYMNATSHTGFPKYFTTTGTDSDGMSATTSGGVTTINVNFVTALPSDGTHSTAELKPGETVTLQYQVKIN